MLPEADDQILSGPLEPSAPPPTTSMLERGDIDPLQMTSGNDMNDPAVPSSVVTQMPIFQELPVEPSAPPASQSMVDRGDIDPMSHGQSMVDRGDINPMSHGQIMSESTLMQQKLGKLIQEVVISDKSPEGSIHKALSQSLGSVGNSEEETYSQGQSSDVLISVQSPRGSIHKALSQDQSLGSVGNPDQENYSQGQSSDGSSVDPPSPYQKKTEDEAMDWQTSPDYIRRGRFDHHTTVTGTSTSTCM